MAKDKFSAGAGQAVKGVGNPAQPRKGAIKAVGKKSDSDIKK